jgi:glutathione S-transferase
MGIFDLATSILASSASAWRGTAAFNHEAAQPKKLLELYEYEGSPYCRLVREVLSELDLDAMIYPCPQDGTRYRPKAIEMSGHRQFPFLVDPNTGEQLLESADIIDYLYSHYGGEKGEKRASRSVRRSVQMGGSITATLVRSLGGFKGVHARASIAPEKPLELYSFESSPYSRLVRELLSELEIPYRLRNCAKSRWQEMGPPSVRANLFPDSPITSPNRIRLRELTGRSQVPYLVDPNTGVSLFESADILDYLRDTYGA